jgi:hypothetical protein
MHTSAINEINAHAKARIMYQLVTLPQFLAHLDLTICEPNTTLPYCCLACHATHAIIFPHDSTPHKTLLSTQ